VSLYRSPGCIQHSDILKRTYLCQVSDTGSPEPLVVLSYYVSLRSEFRVVMSVTISQLPMESVPITTEVVSSNLNQGEVYTTLCDKVCR
jgi:hypothetical protein